MHTELAVLGGGPGGYAAAFLAADKGLGVTIVESESRLGGTCLLRGCIPSKALLHVARVIAETEELSAEWGVQFGAPSIDLDALKARQAKLIQTLSGGLGQLAKRRKVNVITARGRLEDPHTLCLSPSATGPPADQQLTFDHLIIATGSVPLAPGALAIASPRVLNSSTALQLHSVPESLLVVGGGYIGLELGTVYARLGTEVSIVELTSDLLPGVDRSLVKPLHQRLARLFGGRIQLDTEVRSIGDAENALEVTLNGPDGLTEARYAKVLVSVGRRPASDNLGLENTRVEVDQRGFIVCDAQQRTAEPHIQAVGDVAGEPMLAHKATHQAKAAVESLRQQPASFTERVVPAVVFTDPEIAWAGLTEQQARQTGQVYRVAAYPWLASGRAHSLGRTDGLTRWLVEPDTDRLLGCGIVGPGAGELIAEAVLAIETNCTARDISLSVHPHPTLSETLMNAAEVHFGTATEIYKPRR